MNYILRIIALPFVMVSGLIFALKIWITWCVNFIRFGGEFVPYTKKNEKKTIADIYDLLNKNADGKTN